MAGRRTTSTRTAAVVQTPGVKDAGVQRALKVLDTAVQELQSRGLPLLFYGRGSPDGVVEAPAGALYCNLDGGANATLYVKESISGKIGWVAK